MHSPVHANFGLAESTETSIKFLSISLIFPRGKALFSYTDLQNGECEEMHKRTLRKSSIEKALDSLNICLESRKNIQKEEQERAVKELISGNDVSSLHDFEILRFLTYVHLLFSVGSLDLIVASLMFMKGTSCCVLRRNLK